MPEHAIVIVGAGHAGVQAAATYRRQGGLGRLTLVDCDRHLPYERPALSKGFLYGTTPPKCTLLRKETYYAERQINLVSGAQVESIERGDGRVVLDDGRTIPYDALLLATGAIPRALTIPGAGLSGITGLRTLDDALRIRSALLPGLRVVVVGGGYIGLEVTAAAAAAGARVTVLEREGRVMSRVTSEIISRHFEALHRKQGVEMLLNRQVVAFEGSGAVEHVLTAEGEVLAADLVVVGIGVAPAQSLAAAAGLVCNDGIVVDRFCRTSDPAIFAAGDVTRHENSVVGNQIRLECVQNAVSQATIAARNILGADEPYHEVPWFWTEQFGCRLQSAGIRGSGDIAVIRGEPDRGSFSVLYLQNGALAAIDTVNAMKDFMQGRKLILEKRPLDKERLSDLHRELSEAA